MALDRNKVLIGTLTFAVVGLVLLLVRESEGRVSAETKLNDLKYRMETTSTENDNLVLDLKGTIHDLETKLAEMTERHAAETAERDAAIAELREQLAAAGLKYEQTVKEKDSEISDVKSASKSESDRLNQVVKEKSAQISELGGELEKSSARYAALLKEKEALEARNIAGEADLSGLRNDLKKSQREVERLSAAVQALTPKPDELVRD